MPAVRRRRTTMRRAAARPCIAGSPARAAICRSTSSPTTSWRSASRRATNGFARGPASASGTSPPKASRRRDLALPRRAHALDAAALAAADVDLIVVATTTPDMVFPSTACILQAKLGARGGPAFDMQAVCSGFVYALAIADRMVAGGVARNALVVGAEIYSRILDWNDRGTCVLFGDGAGAVVLVPSRGRESCPRTCMPTALQGHPVRTRAGEQRRRHRHAVRAHGRPRRVQVRRQGAGRSRARSADRQSARRAPTSTG